MVNKFKIDKNFNTLEKLEVTYININLIRVNSYNPNQQTEHEFNLLLTSITEDGFTTPIIVQQDYTIVDGEHRWKACKQLGYTEIACVIVNMTPEQMRIATLRHNRARGSEDIDKTVAVLREIEKLGALEHAKDSLFIDTYTLDQLFLTIPDPNANLQALAEYSNPVSLETTKPSQSNSQSQSQSEVRSRLERPISSSSNPEYDEDADHTDEEDNPNIVSSSSVSHKPQESHEANSKYTAPSKYIESKHIQELSQEEQKQKKDDWHKDKEIRTENERQVVNEKVKVYRVQCMYAGDDAVLVESILGDKPAENILLLCKDYKLNLAVNSSSNKSNEDDHQYDDEDDDGDDPDDHDFEVEEEPIVQVGFNSK